MFLITLQSIVDIIAFIIFIRWLLSVHRKLIEGGKR